MRHSLSAWIMAAVAAFSGEVHAADFDGSSPLICALVDLQSCAPGEDCRRETAAEVNLPTILQINAGAKTIDGKSPDGENRSTAIDTIEHNDQGLVLQGVEAGRSWNAVVAADGALSIAAVGVDAGFVVFGKCVVR